MTIRLPRFLKSRSQSTPALQSSETSSSSTLASSSSPSSSTSNLSRSAPTTTTITRTTSTSTPEFDSLSRRKPVPVVTVDTTSIPGIPATTPTPSVTAPFPAIGHTFNNPEVVVVVSGEGGTQSVVPLIRQPIPGENRPPHIHVENYDSSPLSSVSLSENMSNLSLQSTSSTSPYLTVPTIANQSPPGSAYASKASMYNTAGISLMHLPNELLIVIAIRAGFLTAVTLMKTNRRFKAILNDPSAWHDYTRGGSSDIVESEVTICTKIHTFDHLVFGLWNQSQQQNERNQDDIDHHHQDEIPSVPPAAEISSLVNTENSSPTLLSSTSSSSTTTTPQFSAPTSLSDSSVYFEHLTFSEQYDFLGGVSLSMTQGGLITSEFFDHRETLPCYKKALKHAVANGSLPPSAPHGDPPS
ncbi:hypothetical protein HDU76_001714, partial [Blyttiomyces sp. JEL0837]